MPALRCAQETRKGNRLMMRHLGIDLKVTCKKADILARLHANREEHQKMVAEARAGYLVAAQGELHDALVDIKAGKVVPLRFKLAVPLDYTRVYATAIGQLTAHTGDEITLSSSEYNMLVEDDWDWVHEFVKVNQHYSGSTRSFGAGKGFEVE